MKQGGAHVVKSFDTSHAISRRRGHWVRHGFRSKMSGSLPETSKYRIWLWLARPIPILGRLELSVFLFGKARD